jgi:hypothetical protein
LEIILKNSGFSSFLNNLGLRHSFNFNTEAFSLLGNSIMLLDFRVWILLIIKEGNGSFKQLFGGFNQIPLQKSFCVLAILGFCPSHGNLILIHLSKSSWSV